jgi:hypothetical protein
MIRALCLKRWWGWPNGVGGRVCQRKRICLGHKVAGTPGGVTRHVVMV